MFHYAHDVEKSQIYLCEYLGISAAKGAYICYNNLLSGGNKINITHFWHIANIVQKASTFLKICNEFNKHRGKLLVVYIFGFNSQSQINTAYLQPVPNFYSLFTACAYG